MGQAKLGSAKQFGQSRIERLPTFGDMLCDPLGEIEQALEFMNFGLLLEDSLLINGNQVHEGMQTLNMMYPDKDVQRILRREQLFNSFLNEMELLSQDTRFQKRSKGETNYTHIVEVNLSKLLRQQWQKEKQEMEESFGQTEARGNFEDEEDFTDIEDYPQKNEKPGQQGNLKKGG